MMKAREWRLKNWVRERNGEMEREETSIWWLRIWINGHHKSKALIINGGYMWLALIPY